MGYFGLGMREHIPPHQKNGFRGVRGVGGVAFLALFRTFLAPSFNSWSDKKVQKIKKFRKGHNSIPRTKGFAVAFLFQPLEP